MVKYELAN